jgi:hypothetical protein
MAVNAPLLGDLWEVGLAHNLTIVPPGGEGAISAILDTPGRWAAVCGSFGDVAAATWVTFEVTPAE